MPDAHSIILCVEVEITLGFWLNSNNSNPGLADVVKGFCILCYNIENK